MAATVAEVIVVSIHAAEELPIDLYVWIDAWLPRRPQHRGALVALIGAQDQANAQSSPPLDYLQAVARKGNLDYAPQHRTMPVEGRSGNLFTCSMLL